MADIDDLLAQIKADHDRDEARRDRRRRRVGRGSPTSALVAGIWLLAAPLFLFAGSAYAEAIWCSPPDPDGGMRRDAELCGGDDGALLVGVSQVMVVWLLGMVALIWWARPRRRSSSP